MAAAHRELSAPNPRVKLKNSWWRRLSLPLYAATVFTFTVIGAQWYWPEPVVHVPPGTAPGPVSIDILNKSELAEHTNVKATTNELNKRTKQSLPEEKTVLDIPNSPKTEHQELVEHILSGEELVENMQVGPIESAPLRIEEPEILAIAPEHIALSEGVQGNEDGIDIKHNKEQWARKIIILFKNAEFKAAQNELIEFKKAFPNYPIDEQIETLR